MYIHTDRNISAENMIIHRGPRIQHGRGFASLFASGLRFLRPAASSAFKNAVKIVNSPMGKKVRKTLVKQVKRGAINAINNKLKGESVKSSLEKDIENAKREISAVLAKQPTAKKSGKKQFKRRKALLD